MMRTMIASGLLSVAVASFVASVQEPAFTHARDCGLEPPEMALQFAPAPKKSGQSQEFSKAHPFIQRGGPMAAGRIGGILSGKTVYLSPGHGLLWTDVGWRAQRGNTHGIVEDLVSIEAVNEMLIPYLQAMGAHVVTVREADLRAEMVIVDDGAATLEGSPQEGAPAGKGYGDVPLPIASDSVAPFSSGDSRTFIATAESAGAVVYAPVIPASGEYNVYISFVQGADRVSDAHYVVRHSGGETHFRVDQRRHGGTWVLLGKFHFEAGATADAASVALLTDSVDVGAVISTDAVRFGGGMGVHNRGGGVTGRPMHEHCARYYTQWAGAPPSVFASSTTSDHTDDVASRPRFAAWDHEDGEDAVYVAWHTNAPNPGRGTESYTYASGTAPPGPLSAFNGVQGSRALQDALHNELVADLRAAWDPTWVDRGRFTAYFGEVNPNHNNEVPGVLLEIGFHDTQGEAEQMASPAFRQVATRAIAQGIARYFAEKDGKPLILPPEPPKSIWMTNDGTGGLEVQWRAPDNGPAGGDPPTGYIVQVSKNGYGFDDGTWVDGTSHTLEGLYAGDVRYVRVLSVNAGGHSLPSQTVAAALASSGAGSVLIVSGFDRFDRGLLVRDDLSAFSLGTVRRMLLSRINDGSYSVRHAQAISEAGISFDGATDDAIEDGVLALDGYQAVDWFAGEDSTDDQPLSPLARDALTDYLDGGGRLLLSGSELAWALDNNGAPDEKAFFNDRLHARFLADDAETYDVAALPGPFDGAAPLSFADLTTYDAEYPDVLEATEGAALVLAYQAGTGMGAGVVWGEGSDGDRGVLLGFPFETIASAEARADLMTRTLAFFDVQEPDGPIGETGGDEGGTAGGVATAGTGEESEGALSSSGFYERGGDVGGCGCTSGGRDRHFGWLFALAIGGFLRRSRLRARS